MSRTGLCQLLLVVACSLVSAAAAHAAFDFDLNVAGFSGAEAAAIAKAEAMWEEVILGYQPGISLSGIDVRIRQRSIDGAGGVLGSAGPTFISNQQGFTLSTNGTITLDSADVNVLLTDGELDDVIAHELGHILGIGTLWTNNGVYINGTGHYTGALGLAAYQQEFDAGASFVPVELDGGSGTANGHWDELGSVFDPLGRPLTQELMTGYLSPDAFLSYTTIQSLGDLGLDVTGAFPPLPGDGNGDGEIDGADYLIWATNYGDNPADEPPGSPANGDFNDDGIVDGDDYLLWAGGYSVDAPAVTAFAGVSNIVADNVPEPSTLLLAVMAMTSALITRRCSIA
jgi:hypothetical protein